MATPKGELLQAIVTKQEGILQQMAALRADLDKVALDLKSVCYYKDNIFSQMDCENKYKTKRVQLQTSIAALTTELNQAKAEYDAVLREPDKGQSQNRATTSNGSSLSLGDAVFATVGIVTVGLFAFGLASRVWR